MSQSRFIKYDRRKLRKEKRTIPVFGADEQAGKLFRCWNCGFICNKDRDQIGDGVGYSVVDQGLQVDPKGVEIPDTHSYTQRVSSGCPFCGSRAYR